MARVKQFNVKDRIFARKFKADTKDKKFKIRRLPTNRVNRYWPDNKLFLDQEDTPECVGFCGAHWMINSPVTQYLDPHGLYELAQYYDEFPGASYEGSTIRGMAKGFEKLGLISEYKWTWE